MLFNRKVIMTKPVSLNTKVLNEEIKLSFGAREAKQHFGDKFMRLADAHMPCQVKASKFKQMADKEAKKLEAFLRESYRLNGAALPQAVTEAMMEGVCDAIARDATGWDQAKGSPTAIAEAALNGKSSANDAIEQLFDRFHPKA